MSLDEAGADFGITMERVKKTLQVIEAVTRDWQQPRV